MARIVRLPAIAAVALVLAASPGAARAETLDLFRVATPAEAQSAPAQKPGGRAEARGRIVALDPAAFSAAAAKRQPGAPRKLRMRLFPDADAVFDETSDEPADDGGSVWNGTAGASGDATLVIAPDGAVTGRVTLKGRVFQIAPRGGGLHRISELRRSDLPPVGPHMRAPGRKSERPSAAPAVASGTPAAAKAATEITALFVYTEKARDAAIDSGTKIKSEIDLAVALANKAYAASGVRIKLKLVGTLLVEGYDESARSYSDVLTDLTDLAGPFAAVGPRRDKKKADLVALLREGGEYCGLAWVVDEPSAESSDLGFSETTWDCISFDVVAHELGHNMGLLHDRFVEGDAPKSQYNFGYVNLGKRVRDIMSYSDKCDRKDVVCEQETRFSTPKKTVGGKPFGVPKGKKGAADAARRLNETREGVASYR